MKNKNYNLEKTTEFDENSMELGFYNEKIEYFLSIIKKVLNKKNKSKILDLGCYDGRFGEMVYRKEGIKIDGADISGKNLRKARFLRNKFLINLDSPLRWNIIAKYDLVFAGDMIEHLVHTDEFMINVNKLISMGGYLVISTPNVASLGRRLRLLSGRNPFLEVSKVKRINKFPAHPVGHLRYFTKETLSAIIEYYGFKVENFHSAGIGLPLGIIGKFINELFPSLGWHFTAVSRKIKEY